MKKVMPISVHMLIPCSSFLILEYFLSHSPPIDFYPIFQGLAQIKGIYLFGRGCSRQNKFLFVLSVAQYYSIQLCSVLF